MFSSGKDRTQSRNFNQSIDFSSDNQFTQSSANQGRSFHHQHSGSLTFFQQISQSIFGSSSSNNQAQNQNKDKLTQSLEQLNKGILRGKDIITIYLDLTFKSSTKLQVQDDTTVAEILKILKQKYTVNQSPNNPQQPQLLQNKGLSVSNFHQPAHSISNPGSLTDRSQFQSNSELGLNQSQMRKSQGQSLSKSDSLQQQKEDYGIFMINTRSVNPFLFVRKLLHQDLILRVYQKSVTEFLRRDGDDSRFKFVFCRQQEVEQAIRIRSGQSMAQFDEENHVVSQLGKSIINNKTYERKGKLYKKSLNSDKFKERQFVLDKDQLFYYKNEKTKDKNFNLIMLTKAQIHILENYSKSQKYCFQIENENRKYILSTKSKYDLDQWVFAIQGQIQLSKDNKNIEDVNQTIVLKEKECAQHDMMLIQKIFKPKNVIFNPVQPVLLDFIQDPFINELLPNLTKFMSLAREKDYQRHALDKAKDIIQQLKQLKEKLDKSGHNHSSVQPSQVNEDYKHYKSLRPDQKIQQLFSSEEYTLILQEFNQYQSLVSTLDQNPNNNLQQQQSYINSKLFYPILLKITRIIKYNYLDEFYKEKRVELLSIPTQNFKINQTKMEFNSIGQSLQLRQNTQKNSNIFEAILTKKSGKYTQQSQQQQSKQSIQIDQNFQHQIKAFVKDLSNDQMNQNGQTIPNQQQQIPAISKIPSNSAQSEQVYNLNPRKSAIKQQ